MNALSISLCQEIYLTIQCSNSSNFLLLEVNNVHYLLCVQNLDQAEHTITIKDESKFYICGFLRFVNLEYHRKLNNLLGKVRNGFKSNKQWIAIYEILSFQRKNMVRYNWKHPAYGQEVIISTRDSQNVHFTNKIISNCFRNNQQYFYFVENEEQIMHKNHFGVVFDNIRDQIQGIQYQIGEIIVCIPFNIVFLNMNSILKIDHSISNILMKTVYLELNGSNSTGTLISNNKILTVKHAFSSKNIYIGQQINLRLYPYFQTIKAFISENSTYDIDGVILEFEFKQQSIESIFNHGSQILNLQLKHQQVSKIDSLVTVGSQIKALGFGKYNYSLATFDRVDLLLPTILRGVISKRMEFGSQLVLFKTDAKLYHGFSGCGIWKGNNHIGMAVFIIKNTTTFSQLNKHNFSYCRTFLEKYLSKSKKIEKQSELERYIKNVDKFGVRNNMLVLPKL